MTETEAWDQILRWGAAATIGLAFAAVLGGGLLKLPRALTRREVASDGMLVCGVCSAAWGAWVLGQAAGLALLVGALLVIVGVRLGQENGGEG